MFPKNTAICWKYSQPESEPKPLFFKLESYPQKKIDRLRNIVGDYGTGINSAATAAGAITSPLAVYYMYTFVLFVPRLILPQRYIHRGRTDIVIPRFDLHRPFSLMWPDLADFPAHPFLHLSAWTWERGLYPSSRWCIYLCGSPTNPSFFPFPLFTLL
jgi:hypothetical protein